MLIEKNWSAKVADQIKACDEQLDEDGCKLGWAAFHSSRQCDLVTSDVQETINSMLPVMEHVAHTAALQYHYMSTVRNYTSFVNPGQTTVLCADQPLYALQKSISWAYAAQFTKKDSQVMDILPFFGPLHIEQNLLSCTGDLVKGTGLDDVLRAAGVLMIGITTAFCDVNNIKKARYAGQVMAPVLQTLLHDSYRESTGKKTVDDLELWATEQDNTNFKYFYGILQHLLKINVFISSIRNAQFDLFVSSLEELCPILFSLDHTHYARWIPVFVNDLKVLKVTDPELHEEFAKGYFVASKSKIPFSKMGFDQVLEQNNKIIKSRAGLEDLLNKADTSFLRRWENVMPEVQDFLERSEQDKSGSPHSHKEAMASFVKRYVGDCRAVYGQFSTNPFLVNTPTKINSDIVMPPCVVEDMAKVFTVGVVQYNEYKKTRFIFGDKDVINTKITKNMLKLPKDADKHMVVNPVKVLPCATLIKLRSAAIHRPQLASKLLQFDFTGNLLVMKVINNYLSSLSA